MNALGIALVWCVIQVSILASVACALYGLASRSGPSTRALAAFAGLVLITILSGLTFSPWPHWQTTLEFADTNQKVSERAGIDSTTGETAIEEGGAASELVSREIGTTGVRGKQGADLSSPAAAFFEALVSEMQWLPVPAESQTWGWSAYMAMLLLIGAGVGLLRLVAGLAVVRRYRLRARPIRGSTWRCCGARQRDRFQRDAE